MSNATLVEIVGGTAGAPSGAVITVQESPLPLTDISETMTGSWVRISAEDSTRCTLLLSNVGSNNMGVYFAPIGNANTPPVPTGIGSEGVSTMVPGGTFAPPPVPTNEVWVIGTLTDVVTGFVG